MSLFGQSTATTTQNKPLFGSTNTSQGQQNSGGFGGFGQQQQQTQPSTSLFGASTQPAANTQSSGSIFGASTQASQPTTSLFGATAQPQQASSIFGQSTQQPQQQQTSSLFGQPAQQPQQQNSLFGQSTQQQQPQQSLFGQSSAPQQQQQQLSQSTRAPLWQPGGSISARGKTVPEQMQTLLEKWSPESTNCSFQHYFYNNVQAEAVPYYGPGVGEDEQAWEEALAKKPHDGAIPVLCKGFSALGNRLRIQVQAVTALQTRLHEINNSLTAMLQNHDLEISIRAADARRRHITLSQRSLQLATKVQILRNRGYAMDRAEEDLKRKLSQLERSIFDPQLSGRQEEIWARMVGIRERARFLQQETENAGNVMANGQKETLDEDLVQRTNKILSDYDAQISHLAHEMETIRKDFEDWQTGVPTER